MLGFIIKCCVLEKYVGNNIAITIPNCVKSIVYSAFSDCKYLRSITIPDSVVDISVSAFSGCEMLREIDVDSNNEYYTSIDGVLFNKDVSKIICYPVAKTNARYVIPDSVTSISNGAFNSYKNLTNITIPNSVTSIGDDAFDNCPKLKINWKSNFQVSFHGEYAQTTSYHHTGSGCLFALLKIFISIFK